MDKSTLKQLGIYAATGSAPANYSVELVGKSFAGELKKIIPNYDAFRRHKLDVYELMQEIFDEVLPKKVKERFGAMADVRVLNHGQKYTFKKKVGRARAKSFITKVGLGGVFETFRLDQTEFDIPVTAIGGSAILDFERLLDGSESLAEYTEVLMEGMEEEILNMVVNALNASVSAVGRPSNTRKIDSSFTKASFDKLVNTVRAYGDPVVMCTQDFADKLPAHTIGTTTTQEDALDIRNYGALQVYKGCPISILPQSFTDETNQVKAIDPQYCYILPSAGAKIATIVLEGGTIVDDFKNKNRSMEISTYQKVGVAILHNNNWAIYKVTELAE